MMWIYLGFGIWSLLGLSILFAILAEMKKSWILMLISCLASLPNVIFIIITPLNMYMHLWILWFLIQLFRFITIYKKVKLTNMRILQIYLWGAAILLFVSYLLKPLHSQ